MRTVIAANRRSARSFLYPAILALLASAWPACAFASFHLNEITKVMVGFDGDASVQAIEMKMLFNGENLVSGKTVKVYNGSGALLATLGTFSADLPLANAIAGRNILIATMKFKQRFGITPDLQISAGIPVTTGQVSFEDIGCVVDAAAYGNVTSFLVGTTAAPPLPSAGAAVLVRFVDCGTFPACPLGDDTGSNFFLTTAGGSHPVTFTNNSGVTVSVGSTSTGVEAEPATIRLRIAPNPVRGSASIESPHGGAFTLYDLRGRRVRTIPAVQSAGPVRAAWDGKDERGRPLASGVYFIRQDGAGGPLVRRFVVAR